MGSARDRVSDPRHARSVACPSWPPLGQSRPISRFTPASPPRFPVSPTRATRALAPRLPVPSDVHSQALITVDVEPPGRPEEGLTRWNPTAWMRHYRQEAGAYFWRGISQKDFARDALPATNARILQAVIDDGLRERDADFIAMFSFLYADGHQMLSVGGMIGSEEDKRGIRSLDRKELFFMRDSITEKPFLIRVPLVTRKERHYLDQNMPCCKNWSPSAFEIRLNDIEDYSTIYRYYPAYTEMLL